MRILLRLIIVVVVVVVVAMMDHPVGNKELFAACQKTKVFPKAFIFIKYFNHFYIYQLLTAVKTNFNILLYIVQYYNNS
jgi:hypothetical protein